jgi:cytochrome c556
MKHDSKAVLIGLPASLLAVGLMLGAQAEEVPMEKVEPAIKYRQNVMSAMGGLTGTAIGQLRDGFSYGPDLKAVAAALEALSADIPALFPPGTDFGETKAKPEVWSERKAFEDAASKAKDEIAAFAKAVDGGDRRAMLAAFKEVGDTCKGCHQDFRKK